MELHTTRCKASRALSCCQLCYQTTLLPLFLQLLLSPQVQQPAQHSPLTGKELPCLQLAGM
jgi:hypothetical protein